MQNLNTKTFWSLFICFFFLSLRYNLKQIDNMMLQKKLFAMMAAAVILLGMTVCTNEDNSSSDDMEVLEKSLIGIWWDEDGAPASTRIMSFSIGFSDGGTTGIETQPMLNLQCSMTITGTRSTVASCKASPCRWAYIY